MVLKIFNDSFFNQNVQDLVSAVLFGLVKMNHNVLRTPINWKSKDNNTSLEVTVAMEDKDLEKIKEEKIKKMLDQAKAGVVKLTSSSFDSFLNTGLPVLVDFWADWCMPCRMMAPVMEELSQLYAGKVLFGKVNVDENQIIAMKYGISSIPTTLFIKNNKVLNKVVGAMNYDSMKKLLEKMKDYNH